MRHPLFGTIARPRVGIVLIIVMMLMLLSRKAVKAEESATGFRRCDSAEIKRYASAIFRSSERHSSGYRSFTISSDGGWLPQTIILCDRKFYDGCFEVQQLYWPELKDSLAAVAYSTLDIGEFLDTWGSVWTSGIVSYNVAFIAGGSDSLERVGSINFLSNRDEAEGSRIAALQWVNVGRPEDHVLSATIVRDFHQFSGFGRDTRLQFWQENAGKFRRLQELLWYAYNTSGGVYHFLGKPSFADVDHDGESEMLFRRTYSYGTEWRTNCEEVCPTIWKLHDQRFEPVGLLMPDSQVIASCARLPILVFPEWDTQAFALLSRADSARAEELNQRVRAEQIISARPWKLWNEAENPGAMPSEEQRLGSAAASMWLDGDSFHVAAQVTDPKPEARASTYSVGLWFHARQVGGRSGEGSVADKTVMLLVWSEAADTLIHGDWYSMTGDSLKPESDFRSCRPILSRRDGSYTFTCSFPRNYIDFVSSDRVPAVCGFLMEVFDRGTRQVFPLTTKSISVLGPGCDRLHPSTWFTIAEGNRRDSH